MDEKLNNILWKFKNINLINQYLNKKVTLEINYQDF